MRRITKHCIKRVKALLNVTRHHQFTSNSAICEVIENTILRFAKTIFGKTTVYNESVNDVMTEVCVFCLWWHELDIDRFYRVCIADLLSGFRHTQVDILVLRVNSRCTATGRTHGFRGLLWSQICQLSKFVG